MVHHNNKLTLPLKEILGLHCKLSISQPFSGARCPNDYLNLSINSKTTVHKRPNPALIEDDAETPKEQR